MIKYIKKIQQWLHKPYSFREELDFQITASIIIAFSVFLLLYILKPFGFHTLENNLLYYFAGYGIITLCVLLFIFLVIGTAFPKLLSDEAWTVKKEIVLISSTAFIIGSIAYLYHHKVAIVDVANQERFTYLFFLKNTAYIGIFPVILYVYLTEMLLTKHTSNKSKKIKDLFHIKHINLLKKDEIITFYSSNQTNSIEVNLKNLVYVKSEGNYASFAICEDSILTEKILRIQLQVVESMLGKQKQFMRCHKSYVINTEYVNDVTGNARGLTLHLTLNNIQIPVSRKIKKDTILAYLTTND